MMRKTGYLLRWMKLWIISKKGSETYEVIVVNDGSKDQTTKVAMEYCKKYGSDKMAFDVELLYIAQHLKIPITEVAVNWTEIEGSKLVEVWSWLQMGRDLLFIRLQYMTGAWQLERRKYN
ncbi:dolichyl-phosphate beta-glucosyltransferase isoform X2 [Chiroxiphia lanceolata]|uniref:dolichyl-phosphate beta-glucosyltransferase isoform X2 n=1 Tax=Chiroxiphia lanceolata TaxID=296741 RepID=UPI0013CE62AE|nr:dolichyl-phosphate beta-glucosyltransferase isoform X2 [Chiroxiphia lanceolata]